MIPHYYDGAMEREEFDQRRRQVEHTLDIDVDDGVDDRWHHN